MLEKIGFFCKGIGGEILNDRLFFLVRRIDFWYMYIKKEKYFFIYFEFGIVV